MQRHGRDPAPDDGGSRLVRPYARTAGRTRPTHDLALETLISTTDAGRGAERFASHEHRGICRLCTIPTSLAEVAARLELPLGVVRVLVADLTDQNMLHIHTKSGSPADRPSLELMRRVLHGLRHL